MLVIDLPTGFVAAVLLYAALSKTTSFDAFATGLPLLGSRVRPIFAGLVIGTEFAVAVALLSGRFSPTANLVAIGVVSLFTMFLLILLTGRVPARCQCFGSGGDPVSGRDVARNLGLIVLLAIGIVGESKAEPNVFGVLAGGTVFALLLVGNAVRVLALAGVTWRGTHGPILAIHR
ncbi:MAG: MauE/DoxX family redox-associated membrane protein [Chloroflexota bacterium]